MDKVLSKADLLRGNSRCELVEVPEFGASVWMRQMSAKETIDFKNFIDGMKSDGVIQTTLQQDIEIMLFIISLTVCDENGELMFTPEEAKGLVRNDANVLVYLANKALEISKIKVGVGGFVNEATNTLPNDQPMSLSENSQGN